MRLIFNVPAQTLGWSLLALLAAVPALASDPLQSTACYAPPALPGSQLSAADVAAQDAFCAFDRESSSVALCPKTWSTSPAVLIYDLQGTSWDGRRAEFESSVCSRGGHARDAARVELAVFKHSLNGRETSGTYAPASVLYYHLSRYLQTTVQVPVAVFASFERAHYHERVVEPGLQLSLGRRQKMLHAGWLEIDAALAAPADYIHRASLFTQDNAHLWGAYLLFEGQRYGVEVNGTRESGWGKGQNYDLQRTAAFLALRTDAPLQRAIDSGLTQARQDPSMARVLAKAPSHSQIALWMSELTGMVLLDYILGQQDRVGNIDYLPRWVSEEAGRLVYREAPSDGAIQLRTSILNDNDAGVYGGYANFAKQTGMLARWHHMPPNLYRQLQQLASDFVAEGPVAKAIRSQYRITKNEAQRIIDRGIEAAAALRSACEAGELRFDLTPAGLLDPRAAAASVDCAAAEPPPG